MRKRWIIRGVLLLLGGAAINVAICWISAYSISPLREAQVGTRIHNLVSPDGFLEVRLIEYRTLSSLRRIAYGIPNIPGDTTLWSYEIEPSIELNLGYEPPDDRETRGEVPALLRWFATGPHLFRDALPTPVMGVNPMNSQLQHGLPIDDFHGWPLKSMMSTGYYAMGHSIKVIDGIPLRSTASAPFPKPVEEFRAIPLRTLWPAFGVNTVAYSAALWFAFAVPVIARRWYLRTRGRCTTCGYDLHGQQTPGCPECGTGRVALQDSATSPPSPS